MDQRISDLAIWISSFKAPSEACKEVLSTSTVDTMNSSVKTVARKLKKKLREENVVVIKADKGNCVALLERSGYFKKVMNFLKDNKCTVASVDSDFDFQTHIQEVRSVARKSTHLIKKP